MMYRIGANGLEPCKRSDTAIGTWVSWQDMANPYRKGIVVANDGHHLTIVFEDDWMTDVPACILEPPTAWRYLDCAPADPATVEEWRQRGEAKRRADRADMETRRAERNAAEKKWREWLKANAPAWAKGIMVAKLVEDDCDSQTDYYNVKTSRRVFLGWTRTGRFSFKECRKAAAEYPDTAYLATSGPDAEHRENYSMGRGNYLKAEDTYRSGWEIKKETLDFARSWYPSPCEVPSK